MIPFPEVFAYQEPVDGQVLVGTFGGDLFVPGVLVRQPGGRTAVIVSVPDLLADAGVVADVPTTEEVLDEASDPTAAAEFAVGGLFESAGALDRHDESVDELFDPFDGEPEPEFAGREWVDVKTGGRV